MPVFALVRAVVYATLFIGFFLVYLPVRIAGGVGDLRPAEGAAQQIAGIVMAVAGAAIVLWCVASFALIGRGTPAPFDPPHRLVIRGPYRFVRNPMYVGATLALLGGALFYASYLALAYAAVFLGSLHLLVVFYEEPALRRAFGADYEEYCRKVKRWLPTV